MQSTRTTNSFCCLSSQNSLSLSFSQDKISLSRGNRDLSRCQNLSHHLSRKDSEKTTLRRFYVDKLKAPTQTFLFKALQYIDLSKPKSVASVIYLDVVNNYTVIQHVRQILDDFVVSAVSSQNFAVKGAKSHVLFLPTASQSFFRP